MPKKSKKMEVLPVADLPECHATHPAGIGYDPGDFACVNQCQDKFTCLPALVDDRKKNEKGYTLDTDLDVKGVLTRTFTQDEALERMRKRTAILSAGGVVPAELAPMKSPPPLAEVVAALRNETRLPLEEPEVAQSSPTPAEPVAVADLDPSVEDAPTFVIKNGRRRPVLPKRPKREARPKIKRPTESYKKGTVIDPSLRTAIYGEGKHRWLPMPRGVTEANLIRAIKRIDIGQPFDLAIGMQIVRRRRTGSEIVVTITTEGFMMDGVVYPSLSAAGQWASRRYVSGNDFFHLDKSGMTEIRGPGVPNAVYTGRKDKASHTKDEPSSTNTLNSAKTRKKRSKATDKVTQAAE